MANDEEQRRRMDTQARGVQIERASETIQDTLEEKFLELQRGGVVKGPRDVEAWLFRLKMHLFAALGYEPDEADKHLWEHGEWR
jgi:hypothetical protein